MFDQIDENFLLSSWNYIKQKEYWTNKLSGGIVSTDILVKNKRCESASGQRQTEFIEIPPPLCLRLRQVSNQSDLSLYILLLSILKLLIFRYSDNQDIIVGSPVYRPNVTEETINDLIFVRDLLDSRMSFKTLLMRVRQSVLEGYENQDYPADRLIKYLMNSPGTTGICKSLSNIMCTLANIHDYKDNSEYREILVFSFSRQDEDVVGNILFNPEIHEADSVKQMSVHFIKILEYVLRDIEVKISDVHFLTEKERTKLLVDFNRTEATYPMPPLPAAIPQLFGRQVESTPHRCAVFSRVIQLTYRGLSETVNRLARVLRSRGVMPNSIVGIRLDPGLEMVVGLLGVLMAGGAYLPMEPDCPEERVTAMMRDCCSDWLLTAEEMAELDITGPENGTGEQKNLEPQAAAEDLAYVIFTSGSTGTPNAVTIEHRALVNLCCWHNHYYEVTESDHATQYARFSFDASVWEIFPYLIKGAELYIVDEEIRLDLEKLNDYFHRHLITISFLPTHVGQEFMKEENRTLRALLLGGDKLSHFLPKNYRIYNNYGPTENTVVTTACPVEAEVDNIPIGSPIGNCRIYILGKDSLQMQPVGIPGELCVAGQSLARGYLNNPELTAEKFVRYTFSGGTEDLKIYKTGDLTRWLGNGNIEFLGRIDYQVKIRGYRIELEEVENRLITHPHIDEAVVLALESDTMEAENKYICAYIVSGSRLGKDVTVSELRDYLGSKLPEYMIPSFFVQIDKIPLTANGKIDRGLLPLPEIKSGQEYVAPRNKLEIQMVKIWADVLGIPNDTIGIDDNFFELGGQSLKATILISRIHKELQAKVPVAQLFKTPTVRELLKFVRRVIKEDFLSIKPIEKRDYYNLSSVQKRLYILQQMRPDSPSYNVPLIVRLEEDYEIGKLEAVFQKMIRRHESLRTSFQMVELEPVQRIHEEVAFKIENFAWDAGSAGIEAEDQQEGEHELVQRIAGQFVRPFAMKQAPLLRVGIARIPRSRPLLLIDIHHIIYDGTSMSIFLKEFRTLYSGGGLTELRLQYKDYSRWHTSLIESGEMRRQENYWLKVFSGMIPVLNLPTDFDRPAVQSFEGKRLNFGLDQRQTAGLNQLARQEGVTLFMVLVAVYTMLLSKLSGQEDIVVGTAIAGRRHADLEPLIGMFANTLALRSYPLGEKTFQNFLQEVKQNTLEAFENQDYQFEDLVERVAPNRDHSRNPLFDAIFALQNFEFPEKGSETRIAGLKVKPYSYQNPTSKFDLSLMCRETGGMVVSKMEYNTRLFKHDTIIRILKEFVRIVDTVVNNKKIKIMEIRPAGEEVKDSEISFDLEFEI